MRRIAYVCTDPGIPVFGNKGASVHAQSVLRVLHDHGVEIHLVTLRPGGAPPPTLERVRVHEVPIASTDDPATREEAVQEADARVSTVLDHIHRDTPLDLVYERYSLWGGTAMRWSRRHALPGILEVNAPLVDEQARHRVLVDRPTAEARAATAISAATTTICVTAAVTRWAQARTDHPADVHTVPNGVDTNHIVPAAAPPYHGTGSRPLTAGFIGTLKPWHGLPTLVEAIARLAGEQPSWRLLVVGDGPQRHDITDHAARLGIADVVHMTGAVPPADIPGMLAQMDVAVAPYPDLADFYFSPLKIYEYLAAGLPVVASRVGEIPHVLDHGHLGVLVAPDDPVALAGALRGLGADPVRRHRLGAAAREAAVRRHDWRMVVARTLDLAGLRLPEAVTAVPARSAVG